MPRDPRFEFSRISEWLSVGYKSPFASPKAPKKSVNASVIQSRPPSQHASSTASTSAPDSRGGAGEDDAPVEYPRHSGGRTEDLVEGVR
jgi:hypothetical protein